MEKYDYLEEIGSGGYGSVYLCAAKAPPGQQVAVKRFKEAHVDAEVMRLAMREVRLLKLTSHRNIVKLIEAFRSKSGRAYLVMEYIERTITVDIASQPTGLPPPQVKLFLWQLLQAVGYLHRMKIIHRDIKPANILVSNDGVVKLCDFGFARSLHPEETSRYSPYVVTRWYRAPELLVGDAYGAAVDIWSLGCVFAELLTGRALLPGKTNLDQVSVTLKLLGSLSDRQMRNLQRDPNLSGVPLPALKDVTSLAQRFPNFGPDMLNLLGGMLAPDPAKRLTAREALAHPYFSDVRALMPTLAKVNPRAFSCTEDNLLHQYSAQQAASATSRRTTETGAEDSSEARARLLLATPLPANLSAYGELLVPPPVAARGATPPPGAAAVAAAAATLAGTAAPATRPLPSTRSWRRTDDGQAGTMEEEDEEVHTAPAGIRMTVWPQRPVGSALVAPLARATSLPPPLLIPELWPPSFLKAFSSGEHALVPATHGASHPGGPAERHGNGGTWPLKLQVPPVLPVIRHGLPFRSDSSISAGSILSVWHNDLMSPGPLGVSSPAGDHLDDHAGSLARRRNTSSRLGSPSSVASPSFASPRSCAGGGLTADVTSILDCLQSGASELDQGETPATPASPLSALARVLPRLPVRRRQSSGLLLERGASGTLMTIISEESEPAALSSSLAAGGGSSTKRDGFCQDVSPSDEPCPATQQPMIRARSSSLDPGTGTSSSSTSSSSSSSAKAPCVRLYRATMSGTGNSAALGSSLFNVLYASLGGSKPSSPAVAAASGGSPRLARLSFAPGTADGAAGGGGGGGPGLSRLSSLPVGFNERPASDLAASNSWSDFPTLYSGGAAAPPLSERSAGGLHPHVRLPRPAGLILTGRPASVSGGEPAVAVVSVADFSLDPASEQPSSEGYHHYTAALPHPPSDLAIFTPVYKRVGRQLSTCNLQPAGPQPAPTHAPAAAPSRSAATAAAPPQDISQRTMSAPPSNAKPAAAPRTSPPRVTPALPSGGKAAAASAGFGCHIPGGHTTGRHSPLGGASKSGGGSSSSHHGPRAHTAGALTGAEQGTSETSQSASAVMSPKGGSATAAGGGSPTPVRRTGAAAGGGKASGLLSKVRRLSSRIDAYISNPFSNAAAAAAVAGADELPPPQSMASPSKRGERMKAGVAR